MSVTSLTTDSKYKWRFDLTWTLLLFILHILSPCTGYMLLFKAQWKTIVYMIVCTLLAQQGVCAGAHRLWSHKSYKAKLPLRILLCFFQTLSFQKSIYFWASTHRVHHKYVDTDSDPHNSRRGFFFCHIGWLLLKPLDEMTEKLQKVDLSDLEADQVVMFQKRWFWWLTPIVSLLLPTLVPMYFWNEMFWSSFFVGTGVRLLLSLHFTFCINSLAHLYGTKPYDKNICPRENLLVGILAAGEGWHNYHHTFPWDYQADEFGRYMTNFAAGFIDLMAAIGWAYDLKTTSKEMIMKRVLRTGDGTRKYDNIIKNLTEDCPDTVHVWGWGDKEMDKADFSFVKITHQHDK